MSLKDEVRTLLTQQLADSGETLSEEALDAIWFSLPSDDTAVAAVTARVRWDWWDGTSPVNGVPAEVVRQQYDIPGAAYCVYVDNVLTIFQTHDPNQAGMVPLSDSDATLPQAVADSVRRDLARANLLATASTAVSRVIAQKNEREGNVVVTGEPPVIDRPGRRYGTPIRSDAAVGRMRSQAWE